MAFNCSSGEISDIDNRIRAWPSTINLNLEETYSQLHEVEEIRLQLQGVLGANIVDEDAVALAVLPIESQNDNSDDDDFYSLDGEVSDDDTNEVKITSHTGHERTVDSRGRPEPSQRAITREIDSRTSLLRARANSLSRHHLRPLSALSLPVEIWSMILECLSPEVAADDGSINWTDIWRYTGEYTHDMDCLPECESALISHPGLKTIRNFRLVCRDFNDIASPYACPILNVNLKSSSIRHAERLCRNPLIKKGIVCVQIWLQSYSQELAERLELWAHMREMELSHILPRTKTTPESHMKFWWRDVSHPDEMPIPKPSQADLDQLERRRVRTLRVLHQLATRDPETAEELQMQDSTDEKERRRMCEEGWVAYGKACRKQTQLVEGGSFVNRVGALLAQLGKPISMALRTGNDWYGWPRPREIMQKNDAFHYAMQRPHDWCRLDKASASINFDVARLLVQIPVACHRAGVAIKSYAAGHIPTSSRLPVMLLDGNDEHDALRCTEEELYAAFAQVEQVRIESKQRNGYPRASENIDGETRYLGPVRMTVDRLYSAVLSSPKLTYVFGHFVLWGDLHRAHIRERNVMAYPLALALPESGIWSPKLKRVDLSGLELSHNDFVRLVHGLCDETQEFRLNMSQVPGADWPSIWDSMRRQLKGAGVCNIRLQHLWDLPTNGIFNAEARERIVLYVRGLTDVNPGYAKRVEDEDENL